MKRTADAGKNHRRNRNRTTEGTDRVAYQPRDLRLLRHLLRSHCGNLLPL